MEGFLPDGGTLIILNGPEGKRILFFIVVILPFHQHIAGLAQSVERQALNLMVEGSSPSVGAMFLISISDIAAINVAI